MQYKPFRWSQAKNERLRVDRNVSFEDVVEAVAGDGLLDVLEHRNPARYPQQRVLVVELKEYAYLVPFVEAPDCYFLKTIIPSRRATRDYLHKGEPDDKAQEEDEG